ncbi:3-hydroxyacyl-CoA dehydrogenase family protein [Bradyrhizobium mercantei]|uniref:3-hydroxyacyl-CoA dehydrogenase family protein n=1 Tax=Bradyrhizobium mercantei TaxID=1904807 RepID=UPI000978A413|nr:3-hydroxyacyl-CoA dehydrogenase family protein [Bradyrhizobium mercantei]
MRYTFVKSKPSRSFPEDDAFFCAQSEPDTAEIVIFSGARFKPDHAKAAILIELLNECLGEHIDDQESTSINVLGFARYRNGHDKPSNLVELVRHANTSEKAVAAAREMFAAAGFEVVVCSDQAGRIIDRLVIPKYNAALRFLDEGLASQADMDLTCKLGLGYPDGPIERVVRGGLANHYHASKALFEAYGTSAFAPPRRASVAYRRDKTRG